MRITWSYILSLFAFQQCDTRDPAKNHSQYVTQINQKWCYLISWKLLESSQPVGTFALENPLNMPSTVFILVIMLSLLIIQSNYCFWISKCTFSMPWAPKTKTAVWVYEETSNKWIFLMDILYTCVLRSWESCLRRSVAFCWRPFRWSCICKRLTLFTWTVLEGGGGIRARGADGVWAANHRAGHVGSAGGHWETNWFVCWAVLRWDLQSGSMTHSSNSNKHTA